MKMMIRRSRKSIRLKEYNYSQPGEYFVTICTHDHECTLGEIIQGGMQLNIVGEIAEKCWREIPKHFPNVELDEYINKVPRFAGPHSQASGYPIIFME
jgi:putative transposase